MPFTTVFAYLLIVIKCQPNCTNRCRSFDYQSLFPFQIWTQDGINGFHLSSYWCCIRIDVFCKLPHVRCLPFPTRFFEHGNLHVSFCNRYLYFIRSTVNIQQVTLMLNLKTTHGPSHEKTSIVDSA